MRMCVCVCTCVPLFHEGNFFNVELKVCVDGFVCVCECVVCVCECVLCVCVHACLCVKSTVACISAYAPNVT